MSDRQFILLSESAMRSSQLIDRSVCQTSTGTKKILAFVAALTVAAALPGCAMFPRSSNPAVDQKITADVETRFGQNAELEVPNLLNVQTINRVVYLNGLVSTGLQRRDAESEANQVQGIDKVVNSIAVSR
jgi:osmotically-inducible protein OsmY